MVNLYPLFQEFLMENGSLPLAETGALTIYRKPASLQDEGTVVLPPVTSIAFKPGKGTADEQEKLVRFISQRLLVPAQEVTRQIEAAVPPLQNTEPGGVPAGWEDVGRFFRKKNGSLDFEQAAILNSYLPSFPVKPIKNAPASDKKPDLEPVFRDDDTAVADPMPEPVRRDQWWIRAIVILVVSIALILLRFYTMNNG